MVLMPSGRFHQGGLAFSDGPLCLLSNCLIGGGVPHPNEMSHGLAVADGSAKGAHCLKADVAIPDQLYECVRDSGILLESPERVHDHLPRGSVSSI